MEVTKPVDTAGEHTPPSKRRRSSRNMTGLFALLGAVLGAGATSYPAWQVANETSRVSQANACIARVDANEKLLREKADAFLSTMGEFTVSAISPENSDAQIRQSAGPLVKAGYVISAYAPAKLSLQSLLISQNAAQAMLATNVSEQEAAIAGVKDTFGHWPSEYLAALAQLDSDRRSCMQF